MTKWGDIFSIFQFVDFVNFVVSYPYFKKCEAVDLHDEEVLGQSLTLI